MAGLTLRGVRKSFGALDVLKNVDLELDDGGFLVLLGPSGCGKSTLLNIIAGLEPSSGGDVLIDDRRVNDKNPKDRNIAMVFQSYALYPTMTIARNIGFGLEMRGTGKTEREQAVRRAAELLQVEHLLERKPSQLSGGQRQRVAMGRAIVRNPDLFLFDEPLSNLDAKLRVEMRTEIKRLHTRLGVSMVYVTHDQVEAMTLGSKIAVMKEGIVQQVADPQTVYDRPANLFVAGFIGSPAMNLLPGTIERGAGGTAVVLDVPGSQRLELGERREVGTAGQSVIVGIRPEALTRQSGPGAIAIHAEVDVVEPTGPDTMVTVRIGENLVNCRLGAHERPQVGERIELFVEPDLIRLFDARTEAIL